MLLPNVLLTDDVNGSANAASTSATTTHISFDSLPPFDTNSNTFNDDDDDGNAADSPPDHRHLSSIVMCRTQEMANDESMTMALSAIASGIAKPLIGCANRFPAFAHVNEANCEFHFPTSEAVQGLANKIDRAAKEYTITYDDYDEINFIAACCPAMRLNVEDTKVERTKFPIFHDDDIRTKASKEFPVSGQTQNFRSSIFVENHILGFQTLPFFNDLNMPQAAVPTTNNATTQPTPPTTTISSTSIITRATDIATEAAVAAMMIYEQMEHNELDGAQQFHSRQRQEAQVHNDQEQRASSKNGSAAETVDDGIGPKKSKQPSGETITMDKNSKLENASAGSRRHSRTPPATSEQFMNVYDDHESFCKKMDTHNRRQERTNVTINENVKNNTPLICDDNDDAFENFNIEPKLAAGGEQQRPPPFAHQQNYSDVRDTSSKEVLANKAAASGQCGTFEQKLTKATKTETKTDTATTSARQPSKSSFSVDVLTSSHAVGATPTPPAAPAVYDRLPNFELLPHYYALELVESNERNWTETIAAVELDKWTVDLDDQVKNSNQLINKSDIDLNALQQFQKRQHQFKQFPYQSSVVGVGHQPLRRAFSEMTLTKLEEHEDGVTQLSSSEPPSPVLSLSGEQLLSNTINATSFDEMKFEMRATKGIQPLHESLKHERRLNGNRPANASSSASSQRLSQQQHSNVKSLPTTNNLTGSQSSLLSDNARPNRNPMAEPLYPARQHTTRPAIEAGAVRRENEVSRSASVDAIAVLPSRTQLRRQRRMASQSSLDKDEDPIERLNRLRARISGALSEVKGVLNKYSTETEPGNEPTTTTASVIKDPAPKPEPEKPNEGPVTFRFVRKVRRRSVFLEEDEANEKSEEHNKKQDEDEAQKVQDNKAKENEKDVVINKEKHDTDKEKLIEVKKPTAGKPQEQLQKSENTMVVERETNLASEKANEGSAAQMLERNEGEKEAPKESQKLNKDNKEKHEKEQSKSEKVKPEKACPIVEKEKADKTAVAEVEVRSEELTTEKTQPRIKAEEATKTDDTKTVEEKNKEQKVAQEVDQQQLAAKNGESAVEAPKTAVLPKIEIDKPENSVPQTKETGKVRLRKKPISGLAVELKDNQRRASTGAIKDVSTVEAAEPLSCKTQRRPSDSIALTVKADEKRKIFKSAKKVSSIDERATKKSENMEKDKLNELSTENTASKNADSSNDAHVKKRTVVKRGDSLRRASVAVVEKSKIDKIELPLKEQAPQDAKAQRRASDATAAISETKPQPTTAKSKLISRRPTPRVKAGAKAKQRSSLVLSESATSVLAAVDESTASSANATDRIKDVIAIDKTSIKLIDDVTTNTPSSSRPSLSATLSSAAAVIDRATTAAIAVDTIKDSQKNVPKPIGQSVAIVATSLVQSNEANSRIAHAIDTLSSTKKGETTSVLKSAETRNDANELINQKLATAEKSSAETTKIEDIKKPIHQQQEKIPTAPSTQLTQPPSPSSSCPQQVAVSAVLGALDGVPETESKATAAAAACKVKNSSSESAAPVAVVAKSTSDGAATKAACLAIESNSGAQTSTTASATQASASTQKPNEPNMPELQILPTPVQAVPIPADNRKFAPLNLPREELPKKKIIFKKIVRQKSTEKPPTALSRKPSVDSKDASSQTATTTTAVKPKEPDATQTVADPANKSEVAIDATTQPDEEGATESAEAIEEPPAPPKKPRQVKKKVIIKRQQRRLSVSDQTFFNNETNDGQQNENAQPATETLEKAIAYVTDDEADDAEDEKASKAVLPLKGCMRPREFQVGEAVLYAERYKRTQVRWKKGCVLEQITSISYKLEIDGKEVPAHVSYIKRYTDRKVSFGGKEYLEINYEQIAEEVERARSYSIWNMV